MLVGRGVKSNIPFNALQFILPSDRDLSAHRDLLCSSESDTVEHEIKDVLIYLAALANALNLEIDF